MTNSHGFPILRRGNDLVFNHLNGDAALQVQVTHECLGDMLGSDGSQEGDEKALLENLDRIVAIATEKARLGANSPILVKRSDF
jgi:hypothetical protein